MPEPFRIGFILFPNIMQLDMTGPHEVLSQLPGAEVLLVWKSRDPVRAGSGLTILPTTTYAECPQLDLICVPGGAGMNAPRRSTFSAARPPRRAT
jgi:cyclohexyl-isocyanide hydratase